MVMKNCIICGEPFDARGRAKCCSPECSKKNKQNNVKEYNNSEKGKANKRRYNQSEKCKATRKRYNQSEKGKATRKRYEQSEKCKAAKKKSNKKYQQSEKGKATQQRYNQSEKGKATKKRWRENNPDKVRESKKRWNNKNPDYSKEYYNNNKEKWIISSRKRDKQIISELCEQYDGDLESILENVPIQWHEREAKMQVWFNESYCDGIIAKIKSTPVCEVTGEKTNDLVIHHLYSFNTHPELGTDPANMVRITSEVHKAFHKEYGYGDNTPEQLMEFIESL